MVGELRITQGFYLRFYYSEKRGDFKVEYINIENVYVYLSEKYIYNPEFH